jgi:hypothetical protein
MITILVSQTLRVVTEQALKKSLSFLVGARKPMFVL